MIEVINMQKQKISHCQNNYKIQSKNRKNQKSSQCPSKKNDCRLPRLSIFTSVASDGLNEFNGPNPQLLGT